MSFVPAHHCVFWLMVLVILRPVGVMPLWNLGSGSFGCFVALWWSRLVVNGISLSLLGCSFIPKDSSPSSSLSTVYDFEWKRKFLRILIAGQVLLRCWDMIIVVLRQITWLEKSITWPQLTWPMWLGLETSYFSVSTTSIDSWFDLIWCSVVSSPTDNSGSCFLVSGPGIKVFFTPSPDSNGLTRKM